MLRCAVVFYRKLAQVMSKFMALGCWIQSPTASVWPAEDPEHQITCKRPLGTRLKHELVACTRSAASIVVKETCPAHRCQCLHWTGKYVHAPAKDATCALECRSLARRHPYPHETIPSSRMPACQPAGQSEPHRTPQLVPIQSKRMICASNPPIRLLTPRLLETRT